MKNYEERRQRASELEDMIVCNKINIYELFTQMRQLIGIDPDSQSGLLMVQEADCVPHVHPTYGPGMFFTEDAVLDKTGSAT